MPVYIEKSGDLVGCYHSGTNDEQKGKIGLLSQWTMEGWDEQIDKKHSLSLTDKHVVRSQADCWPLYQTISYYQRLTRGKGTAHWRPTLPWRHTELWRRSHPMKMMWGQPRKAKCKKAWWLFYFRFSLWDEEWIQSVRKRTARPLHVCCVSFWYDKDASKNKQIEFLKGNKKNP